MLLDKAIAPGSVWPRKMGLAVWGQRYARVVPAGWAAGTTLWITIHGTVGGGDLCLWAFIQPHVTAKEPAVWLAIPRWHHIVGPRKNQA